MVIKTIRKFDTLYGTEGPSQYREDRKTVLLFYKLQTLSLPVNIRNVQTDASVNTQDQNEMQIM
jgi:hypothetical protein